MSLISLVIEEARRQGSDVEQIRRYHRSQGARVVIEGRACQVIPARVFKPNRDYPKAQSIQLYLPRTNWPDFLLYVVKPNVDAEKRLFYIVPRGELSADTVRSLSSVEQFKSAWHLLRTDLSRERFARHFKEFSSQLKAVQGAAKNNGLSVSFLKRRGWSRLPNVRQHRIFIEGRRCQVMAAPRCSAKPANPFWDVVRMAMPKDPWGDYVVYVVDSKEKNANHVFVVPRRDIQKTTTRSLSSEWLNHYYEAWHLLGKGQKNSSVASKVQEP